MVLSKLLEYLVDLISDEVGPEVYGSPLSSTPQKTVHVLLGYELAILESKDAI